MSPLTFEKGLLMLEGAGPVLEVAREVSRLLDETKTDGAIIGGVAVGLHGYLRTTVDVDVFVPEAVEPLSAALQAHGFVLDREKRQFVKCDVPVHVVTKAQLISPPINFELLHGIRTVSLADLINMKLRSGTRSILRAKDIGDVIGLIRHHGLGKDFTSQIEKDLRPEYRKLVDAIENERRDL
jgi:hypothetical protein